MKWGKLNKTKYDDDSDNQDSDDDVNDAKEQDPELDIQQIKVSGAVNRIKSLSYSPIVAFWTDDGDVNILEFK